MASSISLSKLIIPLTDESPPRLLLSEVALWAAALALVRFVNSVVLRLGWERSDEADDELSADTSFIANRRCWQRYAGRAWRGREGNLNFFCSLDLFLVGWSSLFV